MPTTWHDIRDPNDPKLDELAALYKLHPLHIEDCRHRDQNAKIEAQNDYLFIVLKPVDLGEDYSLITTDLDFFIGPDYLVSVQESNCGPVSPLLEKMHTHRGNLRPDELLYRIMDAIVDSYPPILDKLSDAGDEMEDKALVCPEPWMLETIFDMKRTLIRLRRIVANTRDVVGHLLRNDYPMVQKDMTPFLRDVYDHTVRNLDTIEIHRDLLTGATELYLSSVANQTNQVMKALTIFGAVATPALVITGIYGMNLEHLPFAKHPHSWGIVMALIGAVCLLLLLLLRRFRWL